MNKVLENMPDIAPDGPLDQNKGLLSAIGDPVGQVLDKSLKPTLGSVTGAIGKPTGEALENVEKQAKKEKGYSDEEKPQDEWPGGKPIGGNQQTSGNPLGL